MICPSLEQIAAAVSDEADAEAVAHIGSCTRCAALLAEQREVRVLARRASSPTLDRDRRAELAAEVMALADAAPQRRKRWIAAGGAIAIALAASIALVLTLRGGSEEPVAIAPPPPEPPRPEIRPIEDAPVVEPVRQAVVTPAANAQLTRNTSTADDVVELRDGKITVDTEQTRDVAIVAGTTRVAVGKARATVIAKRGVIQSVQVFAGSVEVVTNGKKRVVQAGTEWHALEPVVAPATGSARPPVEEPAPKPEEVSLRAFREGWLALRANRHADAIAAFDRATDPVVAEDAVFWAAVASERAGMRDEAVRRYTDFLARFASSPRAGDARAALKRFASE